MPTKKIIKEEVQKKLIPIKIKLDKQLILVPGSRTSQFLETDFERENGVYIISPADPFKIFILGSEFNILDMQYYNEAPLQFKIKNVSDKTIYLDDEDIVGVFCEI